MLSGRSLWAALHIHEALPDPFLDHTSKETAKRWCCLHFILSDYVLDEGVGG